MVFVVVVCACKLICLKVLNEEKVNLKVFCFPPLCPPPLMPPPCLHQSQMIILVSLPFVLHQIGKHLQSLQILALLPFSPSQCCP